MDFFSNLIAGFDVALRPENIFFCFIGCFVGTLTGVLPGLGPSGALSILLPLTFGLDPTTGVIMLAGIYYGAMFGGSTTSVLLNIPGETASVVTCLDGHQMALQGRAGPALGISAIGSFLGGTFGIIILQAFAGPLFRVAMSFGPPEYFTLMILGFVTLTYLAQKSMIKALMMAGIGTLLGTIGLDNITGTTRFAFNIPDLFDGIGVVPMAMGLFGISEILLNLEKEIEPELVTTKIKGLWPSMTDFSQSMWPIFRGAVVGFFLGLLPGGGHVLASFASYGMEKRVSKHPEKFGLGAIEGVAGPETANNAAAQAAFVPLLTMGIPSQPVMAIMLGAMMIHGVSPGPLFMRDHADMFWGIIVSMYLGNVILLILNFPLIGIWVKLLQVPYSLLFPLILFICLIGAYSFNGSTVDVALMLFFGVVGYLMQKFEYEPAPLIMAFVLSQMLETAMRQSLLISGGSFMIFLTRPISLTCLIVSLLIFMSGAIPSLRRRRERMIEQGEKMI